MSSQRIGQQVCGGIEMVNRSMLFIESTSADKPKDSSGFRKNVWSPLTISGTVVDKCCDRNDIGDETLLGHKSISPSSSRGVGDPVSSCNGCCIMGRWGIVWQTSSL